MIHNINNVLKEQLTPDELPHSIDNINDFLFENDEIKPLIDHDGTNVQLWHINNSDVGAPIVNDADPLNMGIESFLFSVGVSDEDARKIGPDIKRLIIAAIRPIPTQARVTFANRATIPALAQLDIMGFLRAEYGPWLDGTLLRKQLKALDPSAYKAVDNWLVSGKMLPDDVRLPTIAEANDLALRDAEAVRNAKRIMSASTRRTVNTKHDLG